MKRMTEKMIYDDIRPYRDDEIPEAMQRIADSASFPLLAAYVFPDRDVHAVKEMIKSIRTIRQFQTQVMYDVNKQGDYLNPDQLDRVVNAVRGMASVSEVIHDQANRTVTADVSLNVTEGQVVSLIDKASQLASDLIEGGTSSLPSADKLDDFLAEVKDRVKEITGIELTNQTLAEIRQQVINKVIDEGKEMWANFHDGKGNYVTGDVTLTANGYSVTVDVDAENHTTTLVGTDKTTAVREMGLAIARDMFQQMKDLSDGEYISDGTVTGTVTVEFSASDNGDYAAMTDRVDDKMNGKGYVYEVSLNATADSDGMVSYKFDNGNYVKLTVSKAIQTAYNDALMAAAGDITEDSGAKDKVVETVRDELS